MEMSPLPTAALGAGKQVHVQKALGAEQVLGDLVERRPLQKFGARKGGKCASWASTSRRKLEVFAQEKSGLAMRNNRL
jgi:hypothetical protein